MGAWQHLTEHLRGSGQDLVVLSFEQIEAILDDELPPSAYRYPAFWSNSSAYAKHWKRAGYRATRRGLPAGHMGFARDADAEAVAATSASRESLGPQSARRSGVRALKTPHATAVLVGCVKSKQREAQPARDLYTSALFVRRRAYAEVSGKPWLVLSALYGIVDPDEVIEPYDLTVSMMPATERDEWGRRVVSDLADRFGSLAGKVFEVHAGRAYRHAIGGPLHAEGAEVTAPLAGLRQGEQLAWYDERRSPRSASSASATQDEGEAYHGLDLDVEQVRRIGSFTHRWPDETQHFDGGWEFLAAVEDQRFRVRHATTTTETYGRERVHSVTFVRGEPVVEGGEADDYLDSHALISLLRLQGSQRHVRAHADVPPGYAEFDVVFHDEEIRAPYSPQSLAVKIGEDDLRSWAAHALLRLGQRGRGEPPSPTARTPPRAPRGAGPAAAHLLDHGEPLDLERRDAVVRALLAFGATIDERYAQGLDLARDAEADALLADHPFAFLVGVIADQGVVAERAWGLPHGLKERLGHFDIERIAQDLDGVQAAIAGPPALHRYVEKLPRWTVAAARKVVREYGGDASRIWSDRPTAKALFDRLDAFPGVGQKKAAMGVELLERLFRIPIARLEGSDIAVDVHVRRVFLRTGLAQRDDPQHMVEAARRAYPQRPGALDGPAWEIGRQWCRPTGPLCSDCALDVACPRYIDRGDAVGYA